MAELVMSMGTSHTPMLSTPPQYWPIYGKDIDPYRKELLSPKQGVCVSYEELLAEADPDIASELTPAKFQEKYDRIQHAITCLSEMLTHAAPDVVVIISDDQEEFLFDDNMPCFSIYWGESMTLVPQKPPDSANPARRFSAWGHGDIELDVPVDSALGLSLVEHLVEAEFDVAHARYMKSEYGGSVGPVGYLRRRDETHPRRQGMPHGFSFVVRRMMNNQPMPIVPIFQNTCYPPNTPSSKRCYAFGQAIHRAIEAWPSDKRVAVVASGGLSHQVLDEELDLMVLKGLQEKDAAALAALPPARLQGNSSEIKNWITAAGASEHLEMELIDYIPTPRSPAGTGGGWAFASWR